MGVNKVILWGGENNFFIVENIPLSLEEKTNEEVPWWSQDDKYIYNLYDNGKELAIFDKTDNKLLGEITSEIWLEKYYNEKDIIFMEIFFRRERKLRYIIDPKTGKRWNNPTSPIFYKDWEKICAIYNSFKSDYNKCTFIFLDDKKVGKKNNSEVYQLGFAWNYIIFATKENKIFIYNIWNQETKNIDTINEKNTRIWVTIDEKWNYAYILHYNSDKKAQLFINWHNYDGLWRVRFLKKFYIKNWVVDIIYKNNNKRFSNKKISLNEDSIRQQLDITKKEVHERLNLHWEGN